MRVLLKVAFVFVAWSCMTSASCNVNAQFVQGVDKGLTPIEKDYVDLLDKKSGYDENTKRIRKQAVQELRGLVEDAKKKL